MSADYRLTAEFETSSSYSKARHYAAIETDLEGLKELVKHEGERTTLEECVTSYLGRDWCYRRDMSYDADSRRVSLFINRIEGSMSLTVILGVDGRWQDTLIAAFSEALERAHRWLIQIRVSPTMNFTECLFRPREGAGR